MPNPRESGLLLHITSLPGPYGTGDLGPEAYRFADFLHEAGQTLWQVLPIVPVGYGYSPYASPSTFAGNPMFISPDLLVADGLLSEGDLADVPDFPDDSVDFQRVEPFKEKLLQTAWRTFSAGGFPALSEEFESFRTRNARWLESYALFQVLKAHHDRVEWTAWQPRYAQRDPEAIADFMKRHADDILRIQFLQYLFDRQWKRLKTYCNARSIRIFGDLPIYVAQDSADVWANPSLFHLDESGKATVVAGVPPDYFSETGQRWGNPIYRWDKMASTEYAWWTERMSRILELVDLVRLDHFRGFEAFWQVPASEDTAMNGEWVRGPGADLFETLEKRLGELPLVAENLGVITEGVTDLMDRFDLPGMAILQFAFDDDSSNEFLPHNYTPRLVAYTGTHDNDTFTGWYRETRSTQDDEVIRRAKTYCREYLDVAERDTDDLHWKAIRALMASVAERVVTPVQDVLGLGVDARMNTPGEPDGNWEWRLQPDLLGPGVRDRLRDLTRVFGRLPEQQKPNGEARHDSG